MDGHGVDSPPRGVGGLAVRSRGSQVQPQPDSRLVAEHRLADQLTPRVVSSRLSSGEHLCVSTRVRLRRRWCCGVVCHRDRHQRRVFATHVVQFRSIMALSLAAPCHTLLDAAPATPGAAYQGGNTRAATSANFVCLLVFFLVFFCCVAATLLDASLPAVAVGSPGVGPDEGGGIGVPTQVPLCHSMCKPNFNAWPNCTDGRLALADAAGGGPCGETGAGRGDWWPAGEPRRPTAA